MMPALAVWDDLRPKRFAGEGAGDGSPRVAAARDVGERVGEALHPGHPERHRGVAKPHQRAVDLPAPER